jgi:hypothetical protein
LLDDPVIYKALVKVKEEAMVAWFNTLSITAGGVTPVNSLRVLLELDEEFELLELFVLLELVSLDVELDDDVSLLVVFDYVEELLESFETTTGSGGAAYDP